MGRPEPYVLFAQTFSHNHLDEYVDEVIFAKPVVIHACEFIEQNASSSSAAVTLLGATSPPSFAMELFAHCEGEPRFRRICQPFLYSQSSSNVLEVEAVVTNHIVMRGSYHSLTLVVYGSTAEDLGQFSIDYNLNGPLAGRVYSPLEGKLDNLPLAFQTAKPSSEESFFSPKSLLYYENELNLSFGMKQLLQLTLRLYSIPVPLDTLNKVASTLLSAISPNLSSHYAGNVIARDGDSQLRALEDRKKHADVVVEACDKLSDLYRALQFGVEAEGTDIVEDAFSSDDSIKLATSELANAVIRECFSLNKDSIVSEDPVLSEKETMALKLSLMLILCSSKEGCFEFIHGGGINYLTCILSSDMQVSSAITVMLLGLIEHITRYAIGCEVVLGWWPYENKSPNKVSEWYSYILKLLLQKQRHDIASIATYILHRLRFYELASRFESAAVLLLNDTSAGGSTDALLRMNFELQRLETMLNTCRPIEDPSQAASVKRILNLVQEGGPSTYKATSTLILSSKHSGNIEIDKFLLLLLKERGFLPLAAALLSSPNLRSGSGRTLEAFLDTICSIEVILLTLLSCRSGLMFLLHQPDATAAIALGFEGDRDTEKLECMPLRFAKLLISRGFFVHPREICGIIEVHLRVVNAIDCLVSTSPNSEEFLWSLWEICSLSWSDVGRQAILAIGQFPEAIFVLMEALNSMKEQEPSILESSPLRLAIFHSAAEILEIMITDTTASSLSYWVGHAIELHKALHASSPGTNRKDAPTRLLEWIDAGVVYHKKGAIGLLRYAAVLASGGDAHLTSARVLVSDSMDVENVVGDSASGTDVLVIETLLGKFVSDKYFDGVAFPDSSISQLTTAFRILACIAENTDVAVSLYEEGAVTVIHIVLINCCFMLERSSNVYDYLVDEGEECNSTSDLLAERQREQCLIDLLIPSLVLLNMLLQKLQNAGEQHRNTKLVRVMLQLHREISPKLAACIEASSAAYSGFILRFGSVCHLIVSALSCWPVHGWTPSLFQCLLDGAPSNSLFALGPKESCSLLCLLGDLFPEEDIWLWKNGRPFYSGIRRISIGTVIGLDRVSDIEWYTRPSNFEKLLNRLSPFLYKLGQITLHLASTALFVIQDFLRVLFIHIACKQIDFAAVLLHPISSWVDEHIREPFTLSDTDTYKVLRLLYFFSSLLEHPCGKVLLLKDGVIKILLRAVEASIRLFCPDEKMSLENKPLTRNGVNQTAWCLPAVKSFELISLHSEPLISPGKPEGFLEDVDLKDYSSMCRHILKLFQVLSFGKELEGSIACFKGLASSSKGREAFSLIFERLQALTEVDLDEVNGWSSDAIISNEDLRKTPLLTCWRTLLKFVDMKSENLIQVLDSVNMLCLGCLNLYGSSKESVLVKSFFGLSYEMEKMEDDSMEKLKELTDMLGLLDAQVLESQIWNSSNIRSLNEAKSYVKSLLEILEDSAASSSTGVNQNEGSVDPLFSDPLSSLKSSTLNGNDLLGGLEEQFVWECPDTLPDRLHYLPQKRKMLSADVPSRRRDIGPENNSLTNVFRAGATSSASGTSRRDTFRQRKPNTSRPPSMHVDDYVARERSIDGGINMSSSASSVPRGGSGSGRPPSIHVDEFMARQRERQNAMTSTVGETTQVADQMHESNNDMDKSNKLQQLQPDPDDDLDIIFDGDSEPDDASHHLHIPQPDDKSLRAATSGINERSSPGSFNGVDVNVKGNQVPNVEFFSAGRNDGIGRDSPSLRRSTLQHEILPTRDFSAFSDRNTGNYMDKSFYAEQFDGKHSVNSSIIYPGISRSNLQVPYSNLASLTGQSLSGMRFTSTSSRDDKTQAGVPFHGSMQGTYDKKVPPNPPPLPLMPPPSNISSTTTPQAEQFSSKPSHHVQSGQDIHLPLPAGLPFQMFGVSGTMPAKRDERPSVYNPEISSMSPIHQEHQFPSVSTSSSSFPLSLADQKNLWNNVLLWMFLFLPTELEDLYLLYHPLHLHFPFRLYKFLLHPLHNHHYIVKAALVIPFLQPHH